MDKKEMVYEYTGKYEILFSGNYEGYNFYIISMCGKHPCAYVEIKEHVDYHELEDEIESKYPVHQTSFTYSSNDNNKAGRPTDDDSSNYSTLQTKANNTNGTPAPSTQ